MADADTILIDPEDMPDGVLAEAIKAAAEDARDRRDDRRAEILDEAANRLLGGEGEENGDRYPERLWLRHARAPTRHGGPLTDVYVPGPHMGVGAHYVRESAYRALRRGLWRVQALCDTEDGQQAEIRGVAMDALEEAHEETLADPNDVPYAGNHEPRDCYGECAEHRREQDDATPEPEIQYCPEEQRGFACSRRDGHAGDCDFQRPPRITPEGEPVAWLVETQSASGAWDRDSAHLSESAAETRVGVLKRKHGVPEEHVRTSALDRTDRPDGDLPSYLREWGDDGPAIVRDKLEQAYKAVRRAAHGSPDFDELFMAQDALADLLRMERKAADD